MALYGSHQAPLLVPERTFLIVARKGRALLKDGDASAELFARVIGIVNQKCDVSFTGTGWHFIVLTSKPDEGREMLLSMLPNLPCLVPLGSSVATARPCILTLADSERINFASTGR